MMVINRKDDLCLMVFSSQALVGSLPMTTAGIFLAFFSAAFLTRSCNLAAYSRSSAARWVWRSRT